MKNLTKTAKNLDIFFKVQQVILKICMIALFVGLGIIAAAFLFDLDPQSIGTGYSSLDIGTLELEIAPAYAPPEQFVLGLVATEMGLALICVLILQPCVKIVREILQPMTEGKPFHISVSENLKKLAKRGLVLCILVTGMEIIGTTMYVLGFDLAGLLVGEKITHVTYNAEFDLTFLIVAAVLYLLSWIFRYGEELQQLSDETV